MSHRTLESSLLARVALAAVAALSPLAVPALVAVAADAPAAAPAAEPSTKPALPTAADLTKSGPFLVLPTEAEIADGFKELFKLKSQMDADGKTRAGIEVQITRLKQAFATGDQMRRAELEKLAKVKDAFQNNQIIARIEGIELQMKDVMTAKEEQEKALAKVGDESRTKYINAVVDLAAKADAVAAGYAALAKDPAAAKRAADEKAKVGPQPAFAGQHQQLKRLRAPIVSENIKITLEGRVPMVDVTLNGSTVKKMVVDSGASMVCIPADLAKAMELIPAKTDPDITLQLADGKLVQAKMMKLKSVRVGTFTVNDVDCAVLPPELVAAEPLLGGSFLNNFTYKVDIGKEQLHLARIGGPVGTDPKKPAGK